MQRRFEVVSKKPLNVRCPQCGHVHAFRQPYPYHAGFGNQGFLYNEDGDLTLVWESYDPAYVRIVGSVHPWALNDEQRKKFENWLPLAPHGGRWLFRNAARCTACKVEWSAPITSDIYFVEYDGSVRADAPFSLERAFENNAARNHFPLPTLRAAD